MKTFNLLIILLATLTLAACSINTQSDSSHINYVSQVKLAAGTSKIGYFKPAAAWQCKQLGQYQTNWAVNQAEGDVAFGTGYKIFEKKAVDYANKKGIRPNYIYLYAPSQTSVGMINFTVFRKAQATYYRCESTPAIHDKLF